MARGPVRSRQPLVRALGAWLAAVAVFSTQPCAARDTSYIFGQDAAGISRQLAVDRYPALYTSDFGDCLPGGSLFNVTRFDAGLYLDNATVLFHLDGSSNVKREDLMMHLSLDAYGKNRFSRTFDPCRANISSLCPLSSSVPVRAWAVFRATSDEVNSIPPSDFTVPDYEGFATIQIFANSTKQQIGCFQATLTNGNSISQPQIVAPILGGFAAIAIASSFLVAAYGVSISHMRMHYAHSLPVAAVFETYQSIFFLGALSVNWPSILVAWWSNFAWSAGMISPTTLIQSINPFAGTSGNASQVGEAGSVVIANQGGALSANQIYGRSLLRQTVAKRQPFNESDPFDYTWAGDPVAPGVPLPGTNYGFPGTLASAQVPAADAFTLGLIWFLVVIGAVAVFIVSLKVVLEGLARLSCIKQDRLEFFRSHYLGYTAHAALRTLFIGFSAMATLAMFQLTLGSPPGVTALAAVVLLGLTLGLGATTAYACYCRLRSGKFHVEADGISIQHTKLFGVIPCLLPTRLSTMKARGLDTRSIRFSLPFVHIRHTNSEPSAPAAHRDTAYIKKFGWLSSRYRFSRWWFFTYYLVYQLIRAAFLGGGVQRPLAQVLGLFLLEIIALVVTVKLGPFEGARNTALGVWMLGLSKVITTGLSIAFLPEFSLNRNSAYSIGLLIIILQIAVVIGLFILVLLSVVSTWMSLSRNRADFSPWCLDDIRPYYFENIQAKADGLAKPPRRQLEKRPEGQTPPSPSSDKPGPKVKGAPAFTVSSVGGNPVIEEEMTEGQDVVADMDGLGVIPPNGAVAGLTRPKPTAGLSSHYSVSSLRQVSGMPRRTSWSSRDLALWDASMSSLELQQHRQQRRLSAAGAVPPSITPLGRHAPLSMAAGGAEWNEREESPHPPASSTNPTPRPVSPLTPSRPSTPIEEKVTQTQHMSTTKARTNT